MKRILVIILLILALHPAKAQEHENLQVSLLTVNPRSNYVHTIFGHTALRLHDPTVPFDLVFNWGTFDFDKPNFIFLFIKGETDYFLSTDEYSYFHYAYSVRNAAVTEQVLNIPEDQKAKLVAMLQDNLKPENLEYRYNFIFDNCTSRVRDIIERFCGGELIYPQENQEVTFRKLIHEHTAPYPWLEFGIDCVIGNGADSLVSARNELWLPVKLKDTLNKSYVIREDGNKYPIVLSSDTILLSGDETPSPAWNWPLIVGISLFLFLIGTLFVASRNKKRYRILPAILFLLAGIGGCIVATTCFISTHPCTSPNWNIIWLHPLHLIGFVGFFLNQKNVVITWYHRLNFVLLAVFLMGWYFIPQSLSIAFIPYILSLMLVSFSRSSTLKKKTYE